MLKLYNTLTKKKEAFRPLRGKEVSMYTCGLTVYDYAHIGNLRAFLFADLLRRYLEYRGFRVRHVMNFTDVGHMTQDDVADSAGEDKMEVAAKREDKTPLEIADYYIKCFLEDSQMMGLLEPSVRPRATAHIEEMVKIIKGLVRKKYAYITDGSVYFDVAKFRKYGLLSGNTISKLVAGARVEVNPQKKNPYDFALWIRNPKHMMQWDTPWGRGYPGWHIECSAMGMKHLGKMLDIHTAGEDNIFPHNECEIAQSEAYSGRKFVNYWLHARHLLVNGEKMSKSLGNYYTLRDLVKKRYSPRAIRYLLLSAHYRTKLNFTEEALNAAENTLQSIGEFIANLRGVRSGKYNYGINEKLKRLKKDFVSAMDDDLNISPALSRIFNFVKECNKLVEKGLIDQGNAKDIYAAMMDFDRVLGLDLHLVSSGWLTIDEAPSGVRELILKREQYRSMRDFKKADAIRKSMDEQYGIIIEDTPRGMRWRRK